MSEQNSNHATDEWSKEIQCEKKEHKYPKWSNEVMLRILFGGSDYLNAPFRPQPLWRVLDVGCSFANNLVPFAAIRPRSRLAATAPCPIWTRISTCCSRSTPCMKTRKRTSSLRLDAK